MFCAIQSCFIFSKIVCCITDQLDKLEKKINKQGKEQPKGKDSSGKEQPKGKDSNGKEQADGKDSNGKEQADGKDSNGKEQADGKDSNGKEQADGKDSSGKEQADGKDSNGKEQADGKDSNGKEQANGKDSNGKEQANGKDSNGKEQADGKDSSGKEQADAILSALENRERMIRECYYELQEIDQKFIDRVKPTLDLYGVWFIFHWIFYSLTSVLHSAVIVELVLDVVSYRISSTDEYVPSTKPEIEAPYILYIVFFTVLHAYLFIYPCFRAAAIASARQKLINSIAKKKWDSIPLAVQGNFVEYLKSQGFGFKVSIFYTDIPCGLGLAFVSLFIAVCGGFLE